MSVVLSVTRRVMVLVVAASVLASSEAVAFNPLWFLGFGKKNTTQTTQPTPVSGGTNTVRIGGYGPGYNGARSATGPTVAGSAYRGTRSATQVTVAGNGYKGTRSATARTVSGKVYDGARSATSPSGSRTPGYTPTKSHFWW